MVSTISMIMISNIVMAYIELEINVLSLTHSTSLVIYMCVYVMEL